MCHFLLSVISAEECVVAAAATLESLTFVVLKQLVANIEAYSIEEDL